MRQRTADRDPGGNCSHFMCGTALGMCQPVVVGCVVGVRAPIVLAVFSISLSLCGSIFSATIILIYN